MRSNCHPHSGSDWRRKQPSTQRNAQETRAHNCFTSSVAGVQHPLIESCVMLQTTAAVGVMPSWPCTQHACGHTSSNTTATTADPRPMLHPCTTQQLCASPLTTLRRPKQHPSAQHALRHTDPQAPTQCIKHYILGPDSHTARAHPLFLL
jgi:hypothetical protein